MSTEMNNLADINKIEFKSKRSPKKNYERYIEAVKNPCRFLCGDTVVNIEFNNSAPPLEDALVSLFTRIKNR